MRYVKRIVVLFAMLFFIPIAALAGDISGGVSPTTAGGGAMNTLEDIYNLINLGTTNVPRTGTFTEPTAGPVATGHTLTQVYDRAKTSSRPAKTGQTICYSLTEPYAATPCTGTGQDGATLKGVTWPSPRFTNNNDGTVTDNLTGLIWLQKANVLGTTTPTAGAVTWALAMTYVVELNTNGTMNSISAGDTSNGVSHQTDWRLPNLRELQSLIDYSKSNPALPSDNHFTGVQSDYYWSSTTGAGSTGNAWYVYLVSGIVSSVGKAFTRYVWPVRGGQ